jgi:hypothetical protein
MGITIHVCQSVTGALKNWTARDWRHIANDNHMTVPQIKERFRIYEFEGKKVIPFGSACKGFSYETGCPGHETAQSREDNQPKEKV